jgi:ectoine hydroxylase-related dioxygenase (phytanoyl-CoA dioxygenase family)
MIVAILYLDAATEANGATSFIKGSHRISDADAGRPEWKDVKSEHLDREQLVVVPCAAGSAVFFDAKIIHGAGHNRSDGPRRALVTEWLGPDVLPIAPGRSAYQGVRPRSRERPFQRQMEMTMAQLVDA